MGNVTRVLQVINGVGSGGAEKDIMNWYRNIDREKIQFDFLIRSNQIFYQEEIEQLGGKIFKTVEYPKHILKNFWQTKNFLKENKDVYNVIHVHGNALIYIYPLICAKKMGIKVRIFHCHSTKANGKIATVLHKFHKLFVFRVITNAVACSKESGKFAYGNHQYEIINNAMDLSRYSNVKCADIRNKLKLTDEFVVGHVGRFLPVKNQRFVVDVYEKILNYKKKSKLLLIGDGEQKNETAEYVHNKQLDDKVLFLGEIKDVEKILKIMDVVIFPSIYEGVPLVVLEAQASGTRILYSDTIGDEVKITPYARKASLNMSAEQWARDAIGLCNEKISFDIEKAFQCEGYEIKTVIKQLYKIYGV